MEDKPKQKIGYYNGYDEGYKKGYEEGCENMEQGIKYATEIIKLRKKLNATEKTSEKEECLRELNKKIHDLQLYCGENCISYTNVMKTAMELDDDNSDIQKKIDEACE